jgi:sporulation protein YlmC with PRC-barrel domain
MRTQLILGTAMAALMIGGAFAQAPTSSSPPPPAKSDQAKPATGAQPDLVTAQKPDQWLASKFKGTEVLGADSKKIGSVSDILFDKDGKIEAYVVSVGGFLGVGSKEVAVAPKSFEVMPGSNGGADKLKLAMTEEQLKTAQDFKPYEPPRPVATTGSSPGGHTRPLGGAPGGGMGH